MISLELLEHVSVINSGRKFKRHLMLLPPLWHCEWKGCILLHVHVLSWCKLLTKGISQIPPPPHYEPSQLPLSEASLHCGLACNTGVPIVVYRGYHQITTWYHNMQPTSV